MKAHGRVCLVGEDLDWTGGTSILCGINLNIDVNITFTELDTVDINSDGVCCSFLVTGLNEQFDCDPFFRYIIAGLCVWHKSIKKIKAMKICISSEIPIKSGLSSSAALYVALFWELSRLYDIVLSQSYLCELCHQAEAIYLNVVVGYMDFYACSSNGAILFNEKTMQYKSIDIDFLKEEELVLIYTGMSTSTKTINNLKKKRFIESESNLINYIQKGNELVDKMVPYLLLGDIKMVGEKIIKAHELISKYLMVSTNEIDDIVQLCINSGAYGAKLTGCGKGGYIFCIINSMYLPNLESELRKSSLKYILTNII